MQAIEALLIGVEEPHDYLHIKHVRLILTASSRRPRSAGRPR
jgi:hypothetical protein